VLDEVAERAMLSVLEIKASGYGPREDDTSGQGIERQRAIGSGVMVSADGYIITKLPTITWWLVHSGSESSWRLLLWNSSLTTPASPIGNELTKPGRSVPAEKWILS
jgi:hypothetical protein